MVQSEMMFPLLTARQGPFFLGAPLSRFTASSEVADRTAEADTLQLKATTLLEDLPDLIQYC